MTSKITSLVSRLIKAELSLAAAPDDDKARKSRKKLKTELTTLVARLEASCAPVQLGLPIVSAWGVFHPDGSAHIFQQRETAEVFGTPAAMFVHPWQMPCKTALNKISADAFAAAGIEMSEKMRDACLAIMRAAVHAAADPVLVGPEGVEVDVPVEQVKT